MGKNSSNIEVEINTNGIKNLRNRVFRNESDFLRQDKKTTKSIENLKRFLDVLLGILLNHTDMDQETVGLLNELLRRGV